MKMAAACGVSFSTISSNWVARYGPYRPDLKVGARHVLSNVWIQMGNKKVGCLSSRHIATRASMQPSDSGSSEAPIAPLQLESPVGQFLSQILARHPHLVPAAIEKQLQTDHEAEKEKENPSASRTDLVLYRRIAEVKANERKKALEEILYALAVQKFMDANVSLLPAIAPSSPDSSDRVDIWPSGEEKLECLHSPEAYEMIQLILGNRLGDTNSIAQISKIRVGQVYAASVMYGYFLKRIDQRFQLEKSMKILPKGFFLMERMITNKLHTRKEDQLMMAGGMLDLIQKCRQFLVVSVSGVVR